MAIRRWALGLMPVQGSLDRQAAYVISGERRRSHAEIDHRVLCAAQGLREQGIGEGDCVGLLLRNDLAFFEASEAAAAVGAYPVPINWHSTADEARYVIRDCGAKILIAHRDLLLAAASVADIPKLIVDTPAEIAEAYGVASPASRESGSADWDSWLEAHEPLSDPPAGSRAAVIYTSGTTGKPKGVKRAPDPTGQGLAIGLEGYGLEGPEPKSVLMTGPMYHSAPNSYGRIARMIGATIVLQPRFDAEQTLAMIERYRITHMHVVPTMFVRLLRLPPEIRNGYDLSSLRYVVHGAAPCPPDVKQAMINWWGPVIGEYYGSTETGLVTALRPGDIKRGSGTVGLPLPGVKIAIRDDAGNPVPPGQAGNVYVRSEFFPDFRYIGDVGQGLESDGFTTVGDVGWLDEQGYLFLGDRKRDMIISGGVNIYPAEIEAALLGIESIRDCAVFGVPDREFGEAVFACVLPVADAQIDPVTVKAELAKSLSRFKIPRQIEIVESLPREDSGKVFKRKLRERFTLL